MINPPFYIREFRVCTFPNVTTGKYLISNDGLVYDTVKQRYMQSYQSRNGYWYVRLDDNSFEYNPHHFAIHRLVGWEFSPETRNINMDINHIDGNKSNNRDINLEWVTRQNNIIHSVKTGLAGKGDHNGELNSQAKLSNDQVHKICEALESVPGITSGNISEVVGFEVSKNQFAKIKERRNWTSISKDYKF